MATRARTRAAAVREAAILPPVIQPNNQEGDQATRDSPTSSSDEYDYEAGAACNTCGTTLHMRDGDKACIHMLKEQGYRQEKSLFYDREGSHRHVAKISVPRWLYRNTIAAKEQVDFDRETFTCIRDFFLELHSGQDNAPQPESPPEYQVIRGSHHGLNEEATPTHMPPHPATPEPSSEDSSPRRCRSGRPRARVPPAPRKYRKRGKK